MNRSVRSTLLVLVAASALLAAACQEQPQGPDVTAPELHLPTDIVTPATTPTGATVTWQATATDDRDGDVAVTCAPASGSEFLVADSPTTVTCSATDLAGNTGTGSFTVTVTAPDPTNAPPTITQLIAIGEDLAERPAPSTLPIMFKASDPDGDPLTCTLDVDGDGVFERTVTPCPAPGIPGIPDTDGANLVTVVIRGSGPRAVTLRVSDGVNPPVDETLQFDQPTPTEPFDITTLVDDGVLTGAQRADLDAAVAKWESLIHAGLPDDSISYTPSEDSWCDVPYSGTVDDLAIRVVVRPFDGPGNVAAWGGYCRSRGPWSSPMWARNMPLYGMVIVDSADIETWRTAGKLKSLFVHEIGHALGIGTHARWSGNVTTDFDDPRLRSFTTFDVWTGYGRDGFPPVQWWDEDEGLPGSHWREEVLDNEVMTPYFTLSDPDAEPLSALTLAALAEFGYTVDAAEGDPYTPPSPQVAGLFRRAPAAPIDRAFGPGDRKP